MAYGDGAYGGRAYAAPAAAASAKTYSAEVLADSPWGFWIPPATPLDFTNSGSAGTFRVPRPLATHPSLVTDSAGGRAAVGDGLGPVAVMNGSTVPTGLTGDNVTAEAWVSLPASGSTGGIFVKIGTTNGWGFGVGGTSLDDTGRTLVAFSENVAWIPTTYTFPNTAGPFHVAMVRSAGAMTAYVNGTQVWTGSAQSPAGATNEISFGGRGADTVRSLKVGVDLDRPALFAAALSQTRIAAHYASGAGSATEVLADAPVVFLRGWPSVLDQSPNGRQLGLQGNATTVSSTPSPAGQGVTFTGVSSLQSVTTFVQPTTVTYEAWVKYTQAVSARTTIMEVSGNTATGSGPTSSMLLNTDGSISGNIYNGATREVTTAPLSMNVWHHVVVSVGAAGLKVRVDKTTAASNATYTSALSATTGRLYLHGDAAFGVQGSTVLEIGPAAVWTSQLSDARTDAHYDAATASETTPTTITGTASAAVSSPTAALSGSVTSPVTFVASTPPDEWSNVSSVSAATPTGAAVGDLLLAQLMHRLTPASVTAPAGWTLVRSGVGSDGLTQYEVIYQRTVTATEPATHTWTFSGTSTRAGVGIVAYRNATVSGSSTASSTSSTATNPAPHAAAAVTLPTGVTNGRLVQFATCIYALTNTQPAGFAAWPPVSGQANLWGDSLTPGAHDGGSLSRRMQADQSTALVTVAPGATVTPPGVGHNDDTVGLSSFHMGIAIAVYLTSGDTATGTTITGTASAAVSSPTAALSGTASAPTRTGTFAGTIPSPTAALSGSATAPNVGPTADFTWTPFPENPRSITFDGTSSSDPDGSIVNYAWDFGDGERISGAPSDWRGAFKTYSVAGTYQVQLTVTDNTGATATVTKTVVAGSSAITGSLVGALPSPTASLAGTAPSTPVTGSLVGALRSPTASVVGTVVNPPPPPEAPPVGAYNAAVLADNPLVYYKLDDVTGSAMVDATSNHRNGVYVGDTAPTLGTSPLINGDAGHAVTFDGNNTGETAYAAWMAQSTFSVEILFRPDSLNGTRTLASRHDSETGSTWTLRTEARNLVFYLHGDGWESIVAPTPLEVGVAHHVVGTFDGTTMRLYVDAKLVASAPLSDTLDQTVARLRIGSSAAGGFVSPTTGAAAVVESFVGALDEFAFYGTALSPTRITAHASAAGYLGARPIPAFTVSVNGLTVTVDASSSHDPDSAITAYEWDTDAGPGTGVITNFAFTTAGTHRIGLTVTDSDGNRSAMLNQVVDLSGDIHYITLNGTSGTFDVDFSTGSAMVQYVPDFTGSLALQPSNPQGWQASYVVTDDDGDDAQDDIGTLALVWVVGEGMHIAITPAEGQSPASVTFTWSYAARASSALSISLDSDQVQETPGGLGVDIYNGRPSDTVTFSVLGPTAVADFQTARLDTFGVREDLMVRLPALNAGDYFLRVEGETSGSEDTPFTVLEDALSQVDTIRVDDTAPLRDPAQHWRLFDLRDHAVNYTFVRNPSSWTNVHPPNDFTHDKTTAPDGQPLTWQAASRPWRMEFSGWLDTQAEYEDLLFWSQLRRRLWLIDHRNRAWLITIEQFDAQAQVKPNLPWAHQYTVKTLVFMQG